MGKKLDLQALASEKTKDILAPFAAKFCSPCLLNELDYRKHVLPICILKLKKVWILFNRIFRLAYDANYADYIRRYGTNKGNQYLWMFNIQKQFFVKLVALC